MLAVEAVLCTGATFRLVLFVGAGSMGFVISAPPQPYIVNTDPEDIIFTAFRREWLSIG